MSIQAYPTLKAYHKALKKDDGALWEFDLTASEATRRCGVTRQAVGAWIARGQLDAVKVEKHIVLVRSRDLQSRRG